MGRSKHAAAVDDYDSDEVLSKRKVVVQNRKRKHDNASSRKARRPRIEQPPSESDDSGLSPAEYDSSASEASSAAPSPPSVKKHTHAKKKKGANSKRGMSKPRHQRAHKKAHKSSRRKSVYVDFQDELRRESSIFSPRASIGAGTPGTPATPSNVHDGMASVAYASQEAYDRLKEKYEKLKQMRTTEVEHMYEELKRTSRARQQAADKLVTYWRDQAQGSSKSRRASAAASTNSASLEAENAKLRHLVVTLKHKLRRGSDNVDVDDDELDELEAGAAAPKTMELMRTVTGMTVKQVEANRFKCRCDNAVDERYIKFELVAEDEFVEYLPKTVDLNGAEVPPYLLENIYFDNEESPIFLSRMLSAVFGRC